MQFRLHYGEWRQKNLSKSESDFSALRSKKKRVSPYSGTMVYTDLNGNIRSIKAYENGFGWIEPSFCYADDDGDSEDPFQDYDDPFKPQDDSYLDEMQEELDKLQEDNLNDIFDYLNEELASNEQRDETKSKKT